MKKHLVMVVAVVLAAGAAVAGPATFEWDWPTNMTDGTPIPAELRTELRGTVFIRRLGTTNWMERGTTATYTNRLTVDVPVGAWFVGGTAQFGTDVSTRSAMSETITHKVLGRLVSIGKMRVLVVTE
jgi:hypothetical protein